MAKPVEIDGSMGEGGGQVLRTSLALSMITGRRLVIEHIRAGREKPGLKRQHLACVKAAAKLSQATVRGAELGSQSLRFDPGAVVGGAHAFAIGSAGSVTLVAHTLLPALLHAGAPAQIRIEGGTHVPLSPFFEHLDLAFARNLRAIGVDVAVALEAHGFAPDGGGRIALDFRGAGALAPLELIERGALVKARLFAIRAADADVAAVQDGLGGVRVDVVAVDPRVRGAGLALVLEHEHAVDVFTGLGRDAARDVVRDARAYLAAGVSVGEHLADQLLLPLALARGGAFSTTAPTLHTRTNADVIRRFLDVDIAIRDEGAGRHVVRVDRAERS